MKHIAIVVAGGKGTRMGGDLPKQFIPLAGKPVLMHTLEAFQRWDAKTRLYVILPETHQSYWQMLREEIPCPAHTVVNGGESRFHSVRNGLERALDDLAGEPALIAVHDGVRPFITPDLIERCFRMAAREKAVIPVIPMVDSLRELEADGSGSHPVDRSRYVAVQTPQVFDSALLASAYQQDFSPLFTDDASVVEAIGKPISTVAGERENIKLTTPFDLLIAESLLRQAGPFGGLSIL